MFLQLQQRWRHVTFRPLFLIALFVLSQITTSDGKTYHFSYSQNIANSDDECTGFLTYTQGGWGADPHGNNPGTYLHDNFANAFPSGLTIGCAGATLYLSSAQAVTDFLPSTTTPSTLPAGTLTDPGQNYSNVLASQLVAATLNVGFDAYDPNFSSNSILLSNLFITSGTFAGMTIQQLITLANNVIGGCDNSYSPSDINDALTSFNENYDNGTTDNGFLTCTGESCNLSVDGSSIDITCNGAANGSITITVSGAQGNVSYLWNDGATTQNRSGLSAGDYTITVTDAAVSGCSSQKSFTIHEPDSLSVNGSTIDVSVTGGSDGSIDLTVSGGSSPYHYLWSDGATTQDRSNLSAGTYSVTVTDDHSCSKADTFIIEQPGCNLGIGGNSYDVTCRGAVNGSINTSVTGAQGNVTYLWNDGATTQNRSGLAPGTYSVTATDGGSCSATTSFTIKQPKKLSDVEVHTDATSGNNGTITLTVSGGTKPYTYLWSNGATTKNLKKLAPGDYSVVVTDAHGCSNGLSVTIKQSGCNCVPPTNIHFSVVSTNKVQMCWSGVPCATGYYIKWKLSNKGTWEYRTVLAPDTCTIFTFRGNQSDDIYIASICSDGDTSVYSPLYTYPPSSRVANVPAEPEFGAYPNPTSGHFVIHFDSDLNDEVATIQIMNVLGAQVQVSKVALHDGLLDYEVTLQDGLPAGLYMVQVSIGDKTYRKQIIYSRP